MKVIIVAGARPNFMKVAPLIRAIEKLNSSIANEDNWIRYTLVHTGQHYDIRMSEVFFADLGLPQPDINLEVGSASHAVQTANIMVRFEEVCLEQKPDWVIVVGDVNSTMACTLVAAKMGIRVGHVEAGLRSFDRTMPEEINRIVTDSLADLLLTPSADADENLLREGVSADRIKMAGNIMIDSLLDSLDKSRKLRSFEKFGLERKKYVLVTLHRSGNTDDVGFLERFMEILETMSHDMPIIFPVHPRTRNQLELLGLTGHSANLQLIEPLGYLDFIGLLEQALLVITDSGGVQEETTFLQIPCLTLRANTERPITISQGTNQLCELDQLQQKTEKILQGDVPVRTNIKFWDGKTAERIVGILAQA